MLPGCAVRNVVRSIPEKGGVTHVLDCNHRLWVAGGRVLAEGSTIQCQQSPCYRYQHDMSSYA